jgi:hypothetical protein
MTAEVAATDLVFQAVRDITAPGAVGLLGWWLSGRFRKTEERADTKAESVALMAINAADKVAVMAKEGINDHEIIDRERHVENKEALKEISDKVSEMSLILARNGINGNH